MKFAWRRASLLAIWVAACAPTAHTESVKSPSTTPATAPAPATSATTTDLPPAVSATRSTPTTTGNGAEATTPPRPCGALDCLAFATPGAAFDYVLQTNPRVLAIGEAHAQDDTPGIASSTRRFAEQLLPKLVGKSKHLVLELLLANCAQKTVQGVKKQQAPVTKHQAKTNQNEFVALGKVAQRLGIEPEGLSPGCAEYEAVMNAGDDGVARLLTLVADQTAKQVEALLSKPDESGAVIVTYGGALHNDLSPKPGQQAWSFGPRLAAATQDRYLELDLIVPEFVKDSEAWRNLPWFSAFDREHLTAETILYRPEQGSFVLIFPKTANSNAKKE